MLGFWVAGWHHRAVPLSVACIGAAFLASGITEIAVALARSSPRSTKGRGVIRLNCPIVKVGKPS